jgi:hypothetical protein
VLVCSYLPLHVCMLRCKHLLVSAVCRCRYPACPIESGQAAAGPCPVSEAFETTQDSILTPSYPVLVASVWLQHHYNPTLKSCYTLSSLLASMLDALVMLKLLVASCVAALLDVSQ